MRKYFFNIQRYLSVNYINSPKNGFKFLALELNYQYYPTKFYLVIFFFCLAGFCFSQSKKEQIEQLNYRVDSLNQIIFFKTNKISKQNTQIDSLNQIVSLESKVNAEKSFRINQILDSIVQLETKLTFLKLDLNKSNSQIQVLQNENSDREKQINVLRSSLKIKSDSISNLSLTTQKESLLKLKEIEMLKGQIKSKTDSLHMLRLEIQNIKSVKVSAPKTTVNQVKQSTSYKTIKIGEQSWMQENLNESKFKNGEIIDQATSNEEWEKAGREGRPVWCYYDNDSKNGVKYGKLYNWYAVNDPRGLAPEGWHIPSDNEWVVLKDFLGGVDVSGVKLKSLSGWYGQGNGTNSSKFSGLPGGTRDSKGNFTYLGEGAYFWTSTEGGRAYSYFRYLFHDIRAMYGGMYTEKEGGLSVRCIKD
jgi:uncharacterized protein (TIGR02145 family)